FELALMELCFEVLDIVNQSPKFLKANPQPQAECSCQLAQRLNLPRRIISPLQARYPRLLRAYQRPELLLAQLAILSLRLNLSRYQRVHDRIGICVTRLLIFEILFQLVK